MIREKSTTVEELLNKYPTARDSDNFLIAHYWYQEQVDNGLDHTKTLRNLALGKLSTPESITRCRRKLQELNESLRGEKYEQRHKNEDVVIKEIVEWC